MTKIVIDTTVWAPEYIEVITTLFSMAGFYVDEEYSNMKDPEGDLAIYADDPDYYQKVWILETLRKFNLL